MQAENPSSSSRRYKLIGAVVVAAAVGLGIYLSQPSRQPGPDVAYTTLKGEKLGSKDLQGKVVMVNFWATSCTTCVAEMPQMVDTYNKYNAKGLDFIAVAMSYDPPSYVLNYAQTRQLPFKVVLDAQGELAKAFGDVKMTPTTFVIDKQGRIIKRYLGEPEWTSLHKLLEKELAA
jgi:peroxiredoxin